MGGGGKKARWSFGCLKNLLPSRRDPRVSPRKPGPTPRSPSTKARKSGSTPRRSIKTQGSFKGHKKSHEIAGLHGASPRLTRSSPTQIGR